jgi:hypothetical protein
MQGRLRIDSSERAAVEAMRLDDLERRFRAAANPAVCRRLAGEILRARTALADYAIRHQLRRAYDEKGVDLGRGG